MNLIRQPNDWTCYPCSFAMVLGITLDEILKEAGHDGSKIVDPSKEFPLNMEGFNDNQLHYIAFKRGYACVYFSVRPGINTPEGPIDISGNYWDFDKFYNWIQGKQGVLGVESKRFKHCYHAVAWDGKQVFDPRESEPKMPSEYTPISFTWVFRLKEAFEGTL